MIFYTLHEVCSYWKWNIADEDLSKTIFAHHRLFQFMQTEFGLGNQPETFLLEVYIVLSLGKG